MVIEEAPQIKPGKIRWRCRCDCGNECFVNKCDLVYGNTRSCGCLKKNNNRKHGGKGTRLYRIWKGAKNRCQNKNNASYKNYGARGISFYESWSNDFSIFAEWAKNNGYSDNLELDRMNNNKGYSPDNCRWVNRTVNANNKRNNHYIEYHGETHTIPEWSLITGIHICTIKARIRYGWTDQDAVGVPLLRKGKDNKNGKQQAIPNPS